MSRLQKGTLTPFVKATGISANQISAYLGGRESMSKSRSFKFAQASKKLGYDFSAADWMFNPEKIKQALAHQSPSETA